MTEAEFREICDWAKKRDETIYAWLRYLIGLASGALAVLVSLQGQPQTGMAGIAQKVSWIALGSGILFGALRAYGEVWTERDKVKRLVEERIRQGQTGDAKASPIGGNLPKVLLWSEKLCYCALILAVISLVVFALFRS